MRAVSQQAQRIIAALIDGLRVGEHRQLGEYGRGVMPVVVENLGAGRYSIAHYFRQNGDLVADPEMVFKSAADGFYPVEWQDTMGYQTVETHGLRAQADMAKTAGLVLRNIKSYYPDWFTSQTGATHDDAAGRERRSSAIETVQDRTPATETAMSDEAIWADEILAIEEKLLEVLQWTPGTREHQVYTQYTQKFFRGKLLEKLVAGKKPKRGYFVGPREARVPTPRVPTPRVPTPTAPTPSIPESIRAGMSRDAAIEAVVEAFARFQVARSENFATE